MDKLFIEARKKFDFDSIKFNLLDDISGQKIALAATVQYLDLVDKVKEYLESRGKEVLIKKGAYYDAHVLGCNSNAFELGADSFLMLVDGTFHAMNNAIQIKKEIYVFNEDNLSKISIKDIEEHDKKTLTKKKKFLIGETVGLLVSTKEGQNQKNIYSIKEKIEKLGKTVYVFEGDNFDLNEFENFPEISIWVNTACFGIARDDMRIVNLSDVLEYF